LKGPEILAWAKQWGLKPGDPIRRSDGSGYIALPRQ
jgi:hypothetical protein